MNRQKLAEKWGQRIPENSTSFGTNSKNFIEVPTGFKRYFATMPFPQQTLRLAKSCLDVKTNEFGILPEKILKILNEYCRDCGLQDVKLPREWPNDLEFNYVQVNTFINSVLTAAWEKVLPPVTKILPGQCLAMGIQTGTDYWLSETHLWIRLFSPEIAPSINRQAAGAWEILLPRDGSTFDRPFRPDVRLTLIEAKEYYHRQTQFILWQLSQNLSQHLGCFIWLESQTTEKPELVFQKIKGD
jgi:hypothetical protein